MVNDAFMRLFSPSTSPCGATATRSRSRIRRRSSCATWCFRRSSTRSTTPGYAGYFERFMEAYTTLTALSGGMGKFSKDVLRTLLDQADVPYDRAQLRTTGGPLRLRQRAQHLSNYRRRAGQRRVDSPDRGLASGRQWTGRVQVLAGGVAQCLRAFSASTSARGPSRRWSSSRRSEATKSQPHAKHRSCPASLKSSSTVR